MAVTKRRLGSESSATRTALMDAVEAVMREDGYGALTARSVAEQTFRDYEYLVIDGGSGPATQAVMARIRETLTTLVSEAD